MALNERAALRSTSWGLGQIMGFNAELVGYPDAMAMIAVFCNNENSQLMAIAAYCRRRGLGDELQRRDWSGFAHKYNGPGYRENQYDIKLARAYAKHSAPGGAIDIQLRAAQMLMMFAGYYRARIDGVDGPATQRALVAAMRDGIDVGVPVAGRPVGDS